MANLKTDHLSPMALGRVNAVLDKFWRVDGVVKTMRDHLKDKPGVKSEGDGMIDYDRRRFNSMNQKEQDVYTARLKAKRYYYVDGWQVPKIVWDIIEP